MEYKYGLKMTNGDTRMIISERHEKDFINFIKRGNYILCDLGEYLNTNHISSVKVIGINE